MPTKDTLSVESKYMHTCEVTEDDYRVDPFIMVIFGGGGDLSKRKLLPALYSLFLRNLLPDDFSITGAGLPALSDEEYRDIVLEALQTFAPDEFSHRRAVDFCRHLSYLSGAFDDDTLYDAFCGRLSRSYPQSQGTNILFYLAVPPHFLAPIVTQLNRFHLCKEKHPRKVIVEKPFGRDRDTARHLNELIIEAFDEEQIYRIDHYLGKDTVQNILFFRFANSIFEPLWNHRYIDHIQITVAEDIGVGHRGVFYEQSGVVRDIVQNHMMQLLALVAMEPPVGFEADLIRDEKVKVFLTIRGMTDEYIDTAMVRGQYDKGMIDDAAVCRYRDEAHVAARSNRATFFAGKFFIDNWRWAGVPFYLRTGKRLARRVTEIYIQFRHPPLKLFGGACQDMEPNAIILTIQPQEHIGLCVSIKYPGMGNEPYQVTMDFNYEKTFHVEQNPAYDRLLIDCIKGDLTLFARQDGVEAMWSVVDPIIARWERKEARNFPNYRAGSWGPAAAARLIEADGRQWRS